MNCFNAPCSCEMQPPVNPMNLFGSPFDCRKQIKTRRFASSNSPLTPEELDELKECIEAINDLLRSLGSRSDPNNTRQLQLHFLSLRGASVKAEIICGIEQLEEDEAEIALDVDEFDTINDMDKRKCINVLKKKGRLATAGRDFIRINQVGSAVFILYSNLISIARDKCAPDEHEPEFICANQATRRELTFNFGEFVSKNKDLVNLFFGIPLYVQLKQFLGKDVKGKTDEQCFCGTLVKVDEGNIRILNKMGEEDISIDEICFIEVLDINY
ncbi:MAG: hypothetical protein ACI33M_09800 [Lysinibacillus sp.]